MSTQKVTIASIKEYFSTTFKTLIPTKEEIKREKKEHLNPFPVLKTLTARQWNYFFLAFFCWTYDALDYFAISLNISNIATTLNVSVKDITWGMTLVLMLRSVGAIIFGYLGDRYGRKWPLVCNLILFAIIQIGTGFVQTYKQFLGVRAIFGIAMGSLYGIASATALESVPAKSRSILSGFFQQGYAFGYLLAVIFQRIITDNEHKHGWRSFIWFTAGLSALLVVWRVLTPESDEFLQQRIHMENKNSSFINDGKKAMKQHWIKLIYLVFLMAGFNFMSHGSQDLYPTRLTKQLGFSSDRSTVTNSVANLGAMAGGIIFGHFSGFIGRRLAIVICCIGGGAMIYPWAFVNNSGINAGVFFLQFFVQGAWGVIPIHLSELSPPEFKAFVVGVSYQLGNLASSASSTIESTIGERFPIYDENGVQKKDVYDYGKVMAIFIGCVFAYVLIITVVGPENRNGNIVYQIDEDEKRELIEQGKIVTNPNRDIEMGDVSGMEDIKANVEHTEQVERSSSVEIVRG